MKHLITGLLMSITPLVKSQEIDKREACIEMGRMALAIAENRDAGVSQSEVINILARNSPTDFSSPWIGITSIIYSEKDLPSSFFYQMTFDSCMKVKK
jgi:hypothetical protein